MSGPDLERDARLTKRRIEACVKQAQMNARTMGGDNATAAMDLLCAFVLICNKTGAPVDQVLVATIGHAIICVDDFWPKERVN